MREKHRTYRGRSLWKRDGRKSDRQDIHVAEQSSLQLDQVSRASGLLQGGVGSMRVLIYTVWSK